MRFEPHFLALYFAFLGINAQNGTVVDKCPKNDYACTDVINSSLCLSQGAAANASASMMAACVQYDVGASNLPGGVNVGQNTRELETSGFWADIFRGAALSMLRLLFCVDKRCFCEIISTTLWQLVR